jgi:hypothetical protein
MDWSQMPTLLLPVVFYTIARMIGDSERILRIITVFIIVV